MYLEYSATSKTIPSSRDPLEITSLKFSPKIYSKMILLLKKQKLTIIVYSLASDADVNCIQILFISPPSGWQET